jgi:hypothetical protein
MLKIDSEGAEFCLPCADNLEIEGVIVGREGDCLACKSTIEAEIMQCKNCGYEIDRASNQGFCNNCARAYYLGLEAERE